MKNWMMLFLIVPSFSFASSAPHEDFTVETAQAERDRIMINSTAMLFKDVECMTHPCTAKLLTPVDPNLKLMPTGSLEIKMTGSAQDTLAMIDEQIGLHEKGIKKLKNVLNKLNNPDRIKAKILEFMKHNIALRNHYYKTNETYGYYKQVLREVDSSSSVKALELVLTRPVVNPEEMSYVFNREMNRISDASHRTSMVCAYDLIMEINDKSISVLHAYAEASLKLETELKPQVEQELKKLNDSLKTYMTVKAAVSPSTVSSPAANAEPLPQVNVAANFWVAKPNMTEKQKHDELTEMLRVRHEGIAAMEKENKVLSKMMIVKNETKKLIKESHVLRYKLLDKNMKIADIRPQLRTVEPSQVVLTLAHALKTQSWEDPNGAQAVFAKEINWAQPDWRMNVALFNQLIIELDNEEFIGFEVINRETLKLDEQKFDKNNDGIRRLNAEIKFLQLKLSEVRL